MNMNRFTKPDASVWVYLPEGTSCMATVESNCLSIGTHVSVSASVSAKNNNSNPTFQIHGILFTCNKMPCFCITEHLRNNKCHYDTLNHLVQWLDQVELGGGLVLGLPSLDPHVPYKCVPYKVTNKPPWNATKRTQVFQVSAHLSEDVYSLKNMPSTFGPLVNNQNHNPNGAHSEFAFIPDGETSRRMNQLFRFVKENDQLDRLEESDTEEEFQDTREDRFVQLNKKVPILCEFHPRFKAWVPVPDGR